MSLKDILVHLDEGPRSSTRLKVALDLARRHNAHLTGIFVVDIPGSDLFYGAGMPFAAGGGMDQMVTSLRAEAAAAQTQPARNSVTRFGGRTGR